MKITFLGGVGTVTGSKYLIEHQKKRILVDCGLFQGYKQLRLKNWQPFPVPPASIDAVILTHAHIDHSGYLPLLIKNGFKGKVYATSGTCDLCHILLPDSGFLQEKDADFANRHGFSKHRPAQPLYSQRDAVRALEHLKPMAFDVPFDLDGIGTVLFRPAGHILGAAIVELQIAGKRIVFSGDLGRKDSPIMVDPAILHHADYLVVESTYGNKVHDPGDVETALAAIINQTAARGGTVLLASFAVGRAQMLLYHLWRLKEARKIGDLPIFLDSPMAINATELYGRHAGEHKLSPEQCEKIFSAARYVREVEDSKALDHDPMPKILISASGMATGGRVLHHLKSYVSDHRNCILFTGFQAGGTRGEALLAGAQSIKIHGAYYPVKAEVQSLPMLSAHADSNGIMDWLGHLESPPRCTFITHGEPAAADCLRHRIEEDLGWKTLVPDYRETVALR
ncbi:MULTISPECIES: MBL fold metallo-hydrolase [unclassified Iodidimonas]|jgi:metallo-beta-lactamase family protein|uniref:MBL fold metallo-hydrolase n=1 Tax=unclassified Iodidimonas TaxID=2626145 RepID=UPI002482146F|nr:MULTISPECIES: MBL fold metallo-hydrolase [unclassified Iodidimonas]